MKWIKASERLPKKSGTVIFRKIMFPEPIGQEFDTRLGFRLFRGYLFNDYNIIEWLDESAESDSGEQVRKLPSDAELSRIFKSYSDCYADTWHDERGIMQEGEVIQAMTEQRFIEVLKLLGDNV